MNTGPVFHEILDRVQFALTGRHVQGSSHIVVGSRQVGVELLQIIECSSVALNIKKNI